MHGLRIFIRKKKWDKTSYISDYQKRIKKEKKRKEKIKMKRRKRRGKKEKPKYAALLIQFGIGF